MASLFDKIFQHPSTSHRSSLFSQDSKFRAATIPAADSNLTAAEQIHKAPEKLSKKRKHKDVEISQPGSATLDAKPGKSLGPAKSSKLSKKASASTEQPVTAQKVQSAALSKGSAPVANAGQQESRAKLSRSSNKRQKTADVNKQPPNISAGKQSDRTVSAHNINASVPGLSQDDSNIEAATEEQSASQACYVRHGALIPYGPTRKQKH